MFGFLVFWLSNAFLLLLDITGRPAALLRYKVQPDKNVPVSSFFINACLNIFCKPFCTVFAKSHLIKGNEVNKSLVKLISCHDGVAKLHIFPELILNLTEFYQVMKSQCLNTKFVVDDPFGRPFIDQFNFCG